MTVRITACLTTYNRGHILDKTLGSLAAQTRPPDELIVSDDCSSDDTADVVERWRPEFPELRYVRNARNLGLTGNLNACLPLATGEYVLLLQDGDEYEPSLIEKGKGALERFPTAGFVFFGQRGFPFRTRYGHGISLAEVPPLTEGRVFFERYMLRPVYATVWGTVMMRRSALFDVLPLDPSFGWVADVDLWMRMCLQNDVAYIREPLVVVDNSPTKERGFNWEHEDALHRMRLANIVRFYADDPGRMRRELARQRTVGGTLKVIRTIGGEPLARLLRTTPVRRAFWWTYSFMGPQRRRR